METKLNSLRELVEKFLALVDKAKEENKISRIEQDIMLDLLRQAYIATEELNLRISTKSDFHKAPVVQIVQPAHTEIVEDRHIEKQPFIEEHVHEPVTSSVYAAPSFIESPEPESKVPAPEDVYVAPSSKLPELEISKPAPVDIDEVPVMSFPRVEIEEAPSKKIETYTEPKESTPQRAEATPKRTEAPAPPKPSKQDADLFAGQTLADKLKSETPSLNEKITQGKSDHSLGQRMQLKPISDLRTAIGINEKFQFVNDLFEGRIELYNDAIINLNNCNSGMVADNILYDLKLKHNWNENAEAYGKLKNFVTRRYM